MASSPKLDDIYHGVYEEAWPLVETIIWGDEVQRNRAHRKLRPINAEIEKLNREHRKPLSRGKLNADKYNDLNEKLSNAAIVYLVSQDNSEYQEIRDEYNDYFESSGFPDVFSVNDYRFEDFCRAHESYVHQAQPSPPLNDRQEYEDAGQNDTDRREELENAYAPTGLPGDAFVEEEYEQEGDGHYETEEPDPVSQENYSSDGRSEQTTGDVSQDSTPEGQDAWERNYVSLDDLLQDTQEVWGSLMSRGEILSDIRLIPKRK
ncbi:hypothetical protein EYZ11_008369 [Aspergillus tanneri]|uniref:Uncharacterized protein n=1 Tax=Aspergillus tanneri TaxID=1220188 RepID=A0A4V3UNQ7_9EURO|nr:hypothetical protein EYZ11_008369 [Aspergillus tanneri]